MGLNQSLSFNFNENAGEGSSNLDYETSSNNMGLMGANGFDSQRKMGHSKIGMLTKMNSSLYNFASGGAGGGAVGVSHISGAESNYSFGRSQGGLGGGLASKISMALSRVVYNRANSLNDDEDVVDLMSLMEELNQHTDLTVKLNNQSKLCKMLETNDDFFSKTQSDQSSSTLAGVEQLNEA